MLVLINFHLVLVLIQTEWGNIAIGANQLSNQSATLRMGMEQLSEGIQQLSSKLDASSEQKDQIAQLSSGLNQLNQAIQKY